MEILSKLNFTVCVTCVIVRKVLYLGLKSNRVVGSISRCVIYCYQPHFDNLPIGGGGSAGRPRTTIDDDLQSLTLVSTLVEGRLEIDV